MILIETLREKRYKHSHLTYEAQRAGDLYKVSQLKNGRAEMHTQVDVILKPFVIYYLRRAVTLSTDHPGICVGQCPAGNR